MKFLADENMDVAIVERLRQDGHQVWYVAEMEPGIPDDEVLAFATDDNRAVVTQNRRDFIQLYR